jgi:hypothetical protein
MESRESYRPVEVGRSLASVATIFRKGASKLIPNLLHIAMIITSLFLYRNTLLCQLRTIGESYDRSNSLDCLNKLHPAP